VINRRGFLAPALPIEQGKKPDADVKKLLPTLDIGSHINATLQARETVGARHERRLFPVACMPLCGPDAALQPDPQHRLPPARLLSWGKAPVAPKTGLRAALRLTLAPTHMCRLDATHAS
jgi:hypothetical protein